MEEIKLTLDSKNAKVVKLSPEANYLVLLTGENAEDMAKELVKATANMNYPLKHAVMLILKSFDDFKIIALRDTAKLEKPEEL